MSQDETPKSGRTSPAPQYLKGARRSGKLGPSRNPSGEKDPAYCSCLAFTSLTNIQLCPEDLCRPLKCRHLLHQAVNLA